MRPIVHSSSLAFDNSYYEKLDGIERCIDDEIPFEIPENWEWTRFPRLLL